MAARRLPWEEDQSPRERIVRNGNSTYNAVNVKARATSSARSTSGGLREDFIAIELQEPGASTSSLSIRSEYCAAQNVHKVSSRHEFFLQRFDA